MSNRRKPLDMVSFADFCYILKHAQRLHSKHSEPIPNMSSDSPEKVRSCLITPFQRYGGKTLYLGFYNKASILFYLFVKNHCLQNGNKRMAILVLSFFSFINGRHFDLGEKQLYDLARATAMSDDKEKSLKHIKKVLRIKIQKHKLINHIHNKFTYRFRDKNLIRRVMFKPKPLAIKKRVSK